MSKFKVGDWVVRFKFLQNAVYDFTAGKAYFVENASVDGTVIYLTGIPGNWNSENFMLAENEQMVESSPEYTGGSVSYYKVLVDFPTSGGDPYTAECNDIIESLGMNFAEGNVQKALFRLCAAKKFGSQKKGYEDSIYDIEKIIFFAQRMLALEKAKKETK